MKIADIAKACHEVNRAYCLSLGDTSQVPWESAPEWQKTSAVNGVVHALKDPGALPSDSHASWLREKTEAGWTWGPVKDPEKKQHPCIVPFDELPPTQQAKDHLFLMVARSLKGELTEPL